MARCGLRRHARGPRLSRLRCGRPDRAREEGVDVEPMRMLLRENRVISSIAAELDQKSCWEVFTDPDISRATLHRRGATRFHRHVLWTRVLSDRTHHAARRTTWAPARVRAREHDDLVLKPNRGVRRRRDRHRASGVDGGVGDARIDAALADPDDRWVVQQVATIPGARVSRARRRRCAACGAVLHRDGIRGERGRGRRCLRARRRSRW